MRFARLLLPLVVAACTTEAPENLSGLVDRSAARRLAAILDYVAADYAGAVGDGVVLNETEFAEQKAFVADGVALAVKLGADAEAIASAVKDLSSRVDALAPPDEIAQRSRAIRADVIGRWQVMVAPRHRPSLEQGRELYAQQCAGCHGLAGGGDGVAAAGLKPPPRSFLNAEVMAELSPVRAFNALTDGIPGTAMTSYGALSDGERWSLAFYVFTLRHADTTGMDHGSFDGSLPVTLDELAQASDERLLERIDGAGVAPDRRMTALAGLRRSSPYLGEEVEARSLEDTRKQLAMVVTHYRSGRPQEAKELATSAYLDGVEPHEASLKARDPELVGRIEDAFLGLRRSILDGAPVGEIERSALLAESLLERADAVLDGAGGPRVAFVAALVVVLREGLEAALLVLMLLGMARKAGADRELRAVHAGWGLALLAGLATWFASGFIEQMGGARREIMEGSVSLVAAVVLLMAGHWVLARMDARRRVDALKMKLKAADGGRGRAAVLVGLGFVAVYREAFEVVLFLRAIALDQGQAGAWVAAGALAGLGLLIGLVAALSRLGHRLKPGPLLTGSGALLCVLSIVLAGKGIRSLQEAGVMPITPFAGPRVEWLGFFPTTQTLIAQLIVLAVFTIVSMSAIRNLRGASQS